LHAGYKPLVASARHDHWFDFCSSEGDLTADEQAAATRFSGWFTMLQRTQLTKSYKMVVLRVLLDRDAVWDGMGIDDLAAACRRFLESHPALRADLAGTPDTPSAFAAYWLKWPLSRWMDEQSGRRWFTRTGDRFGAAFTCPPELRAAFESLTGELVDYRLAHYSQSWLRPHAGRDPGDGTAPAASFRAKVSHSGGKPILFVPPVEAEPARPTGPTRVRLPDGSEWVFKFVKVACNVAHKSDAAAGARATAKNDLPALLRDWFGPDAGLPGTGFEVEFTSDGTTWHAAPISRTGFSLSNPPPSPTDSFPHPLLENPRPAARHTTHVPVYDLTAAAGFWGPESVPEEIGWTEVPGVTVKPGMFVARVTGTSMEPLIPDGSWCLFRPCRPGSREGRIVLVQFASLGAGENGGRFTVKKYHSETTITADGWRHDRIQLLPVNPAFEPITLEPEDAGDLTIVGEFALQIGGFERHVR
jgi:SOS-response transcriptional repressor LexA